MPLEPRLVPILALAERLGDDGATLPTRRLTGTIQARQFGRLLLRRGPRADVSEVMAPVEGGSIRIRLYRPPTGAGAASGPLPLHVFLHGGGWCLGDLDQRDPRCRTIAVEGGCVVASVDYRMAPENAYPVPGEDCYAALCHLVARADELGVDARRVSVGGESAGANLAAVVCLMARDRSGPALAFQWLDVPATDLTLSQPSVDRLGTGYGLERAQMEEFLAAYLRDVSPKEPYASPLHAPDLTGLPPAMITTCRFDPLRDDGRAYAEALCHAGVPIEYRDLPGLVHASFAFTRLLPLARTYERDAIGSLRRAHAAAIGAAPSLRPSRDPDLTPA